jgi:hypothetical protein
MTARAQTGVHGDKGSYKRPYEDRYSVSRKRSGLWANRTKQISDALEGRTGFYTGSYPTSKFFSAQAYELWVTTGLRNWYSSWPGTVRLLLH